MAEAVLNDSEAGSDSDENKVYDYYSYEYDQDGYYYVEGELGYHGYQEYENLDREIFCDFDSKL